jgi:hypothetical protein
LPPLASSFSAQPLNRAARPSPLAGYELLNEIAVGEFCTVHRARSLRATANADVAVKRLRSSCRDAYGRARLMREARVGLTLLAPNLVRVLEVHDEPEPFIVMEYVPGATLRALLAHPNGVEAALIAPIIVDVLCGLSALHGYRDEQGASRPLVHQAPSTRHVLVGTDGVTRLIDLASVHQRGLGSTDGVGRRFLHGELAPEQLLPRPRLDSRCDIFIVGKTLERGLEHACARGEAQLRERCAELFAIVRRACAEAREERFASADEMAERVCDAAEQADLFASREQLIARVQRMRGVEARGSAREQNVDLAISERRSAPPSVLSAPNPVVVAPPPVAPASATFARPAHVPPPPVSASATPALTLPTAPVTARAAFAPAAKGSLRSVVVVAGGVALLTSLLTLSVRGLQHSPPSVSAARQALDPSALAPSADVPGPRAATPVFVTPLAPAPRKRAASRPAVGAPKTPAVLPSETGATIDPTFGLSNAASIATSIRETESRRPRAVARPRLLRVELPENPY